MEHIYIENRYGAVASNSFQTPKCHKNKAILTVCEIQDEDYLPSENKIYAPIQLRPVFGSYSQHWHQDTMDNLKRIHTFLQQRLYYPRDNEPIVIRGQRHVCMAVLFYFLIHWYWGNPTQVDDIMTKFDPEWTLNNFPEIFTHTILYPVMINTYPLYM